LICLTYHLTQCTATCSAVPKQEWMELFLHTMDTILKNWYLEMELHRGKIDYEDLTHNLKVNFKFEDDAPLVETTL
jgi:hypothetical protein